ncbi:MAG: hypothetical protein JWP75_2195 [Frondihabitans sp.]|nr:hypothetical protein [Frondihabitans sp.]
MVVPEGVLILVPGGYYSCMPSLNISFSEAELDEIRAAATETSLKSYVHDTALNAARTRKTLVGQLAAQVASVSAELNARLA